MNSTLELIVMIASVLMTCIIFISVYRFRKERGVIYLLGIIVLRMVYSSNVILEKSSYLLEQKLLFRNIHQTSLNLMVPFFILFVLELTGFSKKLNMLWKIAIIATFVLWSLLVWFNSDLHMIYRSIELIEGHLVMSRTIYSITFTMVCFCILAVCFYFLLQYVRNIRNDLRKPVMWTMALASLLVVLEIIKFINPAWSTWLLPLTVYCGFIGMLMLFIILRYRFFSIVPIARNIVFDTLQESMLVANAAGKIIDSNKQAVQWFLQMDHTIVSGLNITELLRNWPKWQVLCLSMEQGNVEIDAWIGGERKFYSVNVYPLRTLGKTGQGSVSLIFDITEKQRHLEQISQLNQLKDQLFTIVSHDIRGPLALQYQLIEFLEEDRKHFETDHREIIERLGDQIRNTLGMTNNLLEWFRIQREDMTLRPQLLELFEVVEECCDMLHIQSDIKQIKVTNSVALDIYVNADRGALALIIRNLLTNAIKFTSLGGAIHIDAQVSADMVVVSISDNGIGMESEQVNRLFDEKQSSTLIGTLGEQGVGLGLLVSQQFVHRSGGSLWAESKIGEGSVFYFTMLGGYK